MTETLLKNTSSAKIVSARIPMVDYIEFLKQATNDNLSITDFLIMKLYQEDKVKELTKSLSDKESRIKDLAEMVTEYQGYIEGWKSDVEAKKSEVEKYKNAIRVTTDQNKALESNLKQLSGEVSTDAKTLAELNKTILELKAQVTKLQGEKSELLTTNKKWADAYNALKALGNQVWNEVYKHNKENNFLYDLTLEKIVNKIKA